MILQNSNAIDIVKEIGGVTTDKEAMLIFENKLDESDLSKIRQIKNSEVNIKIANAIVMCKPDKVFINTGSESDRQRVRELAIENGEESGLVIKNHTIHYDLEKERRTLSSILKTKVKEFKLAT